MSDERRNGTDPNTFFFSPQSDLYVSEATNVSNKIRSPEEYRLQGRMKKKKLQEMKAATQGKAEKLETGSRRQRIIGHLGHLAKDTGHRAKEIWRGFSEPRDNHARQFLNHDNPALISSLDDILPGVKGHNLEQSDKLLRGNRRKNESPNQVFNTGEFMYNNLRRNAKKSRRSVARKADPKSTTEGTSNNLENNVVESKPLSPTTRKHEETRNQSTGPATHGGEETINNPDNRGDDPNSTGPATSSSKKNPSMFSMSGPSFSFLSLIGPYVLIGFFALHSIFNSNLKGFVYLFGVMILLFLSNIIKFTPYVKSDQNLKPVCTGFFGFNSILQNNVPFGVLIYTFTFVYLLIPMIQTMTINYSLLMLILLILGVDIIVQLQYSCTTVSYTHLTLPTICSV